MARIAAWIESAFTPQNLCFVGFGALSIYTSAIAFRGNTVERLDRLEASDRARDTADRERRVFRACLILHDYATEAKVPHPPCKLESTE